MKLTIRKAIMKAVESSYWLTMPCCN